MSTDYPIEALAQSLHAACLRDLPEIHYRDRDWPAHRAMMDGMTREQKAEMVEHARQNEAFRQDVAGHSMVDCGAAGQRYVAQPITAATEK